MNFGSIAAGLSNVYPGYMKGQEDFADLDTKQAKLKDLLTQIAALSARGNGLQALFGGQGGPMGGPMGGPGAPGGPMGGQPGQPSPQPPQGVPGMMPQQQGQMPPGGMPGGAMPQRPPGMMSPMGGQPMGGAPGGMPGGAMPPGGGMPGQGGQGLDWRVIIQSLQRGNPGMPPEVLAAAVDQYMPMMNQQAQKEWQNLSLQLRHEERMDLYKTRRELGEGAEAGKDRRTGIIEQGRMDRAGVAADLRREAEQGRTNRAELSSTTRQSLGQLSANTKMEIADRLEGGRNARAELSATARAEIAKLNNEARTELQGFLEEGRNTRAAATEQGRTDRAQMTDDTKREISALSARTRKEIAELTEGGKTGRTELSTIARREIATLNSAARAELQTALEQGRNTRAAATIASREGEGAANRVSREAMAGLSAQVRTELAGLNNDAKAKLAAALEQGRGERAAAGIVSREAMAGLSAETRRAVSAMDATARRELQEFLETGRNARAAGVQAGQTERQGQTLASRADDRTSREGVAGAKLDQRKEEFQTRENRLERSLKLRDDKTWSDLEQKKEALAQRATQHNDRQALTQWRAMLDAQHKHITEKIGIGNMLSGDKKKLQAEAEQHYNAQILEMKRLSAPKASGGGSAEGGGVTAPTADTATQKVRVPAAYKNAPDGTEFVRLGKTWVKQGDDMVLKGK